MSHQIKRVLARKITDLKAHGEGIKCSPDTPLKGALELLKKSKEGCVVITEDNKVVGIFTERDFLHRCADGLAGLLDKPISDFLTKKPTCLPRHETIGELVRQMESGNFHHLVVADSYGNFEMVVSLKDFVSYLCELVDDIAEDEVKKAS